MRVMRSLMGLLAMAIMLPCGAYFGAHPAAADDMRYAFAADPAQGQCAEPGTAVGSTDLTVEWKCRVVLLSGSSCGPDRVVLVPQAAIDRSVGDVSLVAIVDWSWGPTSPVPPKAPPSSS